MRIYSYVGPAEIAASLTDAAAGVPILNAADDPINRRAAEARRGRNHYGDIRRCHGC